jgi:hypothetical protein
MKMEAVHENNALILHVGRFESKSGAEMRGMTVKAGQNPKMQRMDMRRKVTGRWWYMN